MERQNLPIVGIDTWSVTVKSTKSRTALIAGAILHVAYSGAAFSQGSAIPAIDFSKPSAFQCDANVPWSMLTDWQGKPGECGQGRLYTVTGKVPGVENGFVKAKIVVPEDNNKEWSAFNGDTHRIISHNFEVGFCITTTMADRPIRIQAYSQDGKKHGDRCTVTLVGSSLRIDYQ